MEFKQLYLCRNCGSWHELNPEKSLKGCPDCKSELEYVAVDVAAYKSWNQEERQTFQQNYLTDRQKAIRALRDVHENDINENEENAENHTDESSSVIMGDVGADSTPTKKQAWKAVVLLVLVWMASFGENIEYALQMMSATGQRENLSAQAALSRAEGMALVVSVMSVGITALVMMAVPFICRLIHKSKLPYKGGKWLCAGNSIALFVISIVSKLSIVGGLGALCFYFINKWLFVQPKSDSVLQMNQDISNSQHIINNQMPVPNDEEPKKNQKESVRETGHGFVRSVAATIGIVILFYAATSFSSWFNANNNVQKEAEINLNTLILNKEEFPVGEYAELQVRMVVGPYAEETMNFTLTQGLSATVKKKEYYYVLLENMGLMTVATVNEDEKQILTRMSDYFISEDYDPTTGETLVLKGNLVAMADKEIEKIYLEGAKNLFGQPADSPVLQKVILDTDAGREGGELIGSIIVVVIIAAGIIIYMRREKKKAQETVVVEETAAE